MIFVCFKPKQDEPNPSQDQFNRDRADEEYYQEPEENDQS